MNDEPDTDRRRDRPVLIAVLKTDIGQINIRRRSGRPQIEARMIVVRPLPAPENARNQIRLAVAPFRDPLLLLEATADTVPPLIRFVDTGASRPAKLSSTAADPYVPS